MIATSTTTTAITDATRPQFLSSEELHRTPSQFQRRVSFTTATTLKDPVFAEKVRDDDGSTTESVHHPWNERLQQLSAHYRRVSPSLMLENKGSVARDHLSNERTYLAWLRTSLSIITVGVAITQLFRLESPNDSNSLHGVGRPLGGAFLVLGIVFLLFAVARYFHTQAVMAEGKFPASRGIVIIGAVGIMAVLVAIFVIVVMIL